MLSPKMKLQLYPEEKRNQDYLGQCDLPGDLIFGIYAVEYIQNLHFEKKKCRLTVQYLYIARVFTGKNNLAKRGKKGKKEGKREREEGKCVGQVSQLKMTGEYQLYYPKRDLFFNLFLKCSHCGGPLLLPTGSLQLW